MLSERIDQWLDEAVTTGRAEGLAEGQRRGLAEGQRRGLAEGQRRGLAEGQRMGLLDGQRVALRRIAEQRFDAATAAALSAHLADVDDAARLAAAGNLVASCETAGELVRRLDAI